MAKKKKSRVPAPPRPVQAPQRRAESRDPGRNRTIFLAVGAALVVAAAAVGLFTAFGGRGGSGVGPNAADGPSCQRQTFAPMGRQHVEEVKKDFRYNSFPPTSGPHYPPGPRAPVVWNLYSEPLEQSALVHNLEHGGVVVQYGSEVPQATVRQIVAWYQDDPLGLVVAPLAEEVPATRPADLEQKIFLTSWTHAMTCTTFDEGAFDRFLDDYRGPDGDAPEKFPLESLQPGAQ